MRPPPFLLIALVGLAVAVLLGLGTWQLQRLQWKNALVAERAALLAADPLEAPDVLARTPSDVAWHRVHLTGSWEHRQSMVLANRARSGVKGEELVTPLLPAGGGDGVLVNRGWYPVTERDRVRAALDAEASADVRGLAFETTGRTARRTAQGTWTDLAPASMSAFAGVPFREWAVLQGEPAEGGVPAASGSLPIQGYRPFMNTTPHLEYAMTWYGIAVAFVAIAIARLVVTPRRERRGARSLR